MKKSWYIAGIIILAAIGIYWMANSTPNSGDKNEATSTQQVTTETKERFTGSAVFNLNAQESIMNWEGRKPLLANYVDRGTIALTNGTVEVKDGVFVSGVFTIDMTTIAAKSTGKNKGEDMLSNHLKSDSFFDVTRFPKSTMKIKTILPLNDAHNYQVTGDLTIKGITNEVTFPAEIYKSGSKVKAQGHLDLDRSKWDVRFGSKNFFDDLGDNVIDNMFGVDLVLVFDQQ